MKLLLNDHRQWPNFVRIYEMQQKIKKVWLKRFVSNVYLLDNVDSKSQHKIQNYNLIFSWVVMKKQYKKYNALHLNLNSA